MALPMIASILVPLDGSAFAEHALPTAVALADASGAQLELVRVDEPTVHRGGAPEPEPRLDNELRASTDRALAAVRDRLLAVPSRKITVTCLEGTVTKTLEEYIATRHPDLLVMSTHGATGLKRAVLGSVADHVVRHSATPVLLLRSEAIGPTTATEPLFRHVILPLDGSAIAEQVIDRVTPLATPGTTSFTLLLVVVPIPLSALPYPANVVPIETADSFDRRRRELLPYLERIAAELHRRGFETTVSVVSHCQVVQGILEYARDHGADLIALTTRGDGGFRRLVLGSVAGGVVHGAVTPVLVFHPAPVEDA